jgi:hypothetical protein
MDAALFEQNDKGLHKLEFIHTATTGGSDIELAGELYGVLFWALPSQIFTHSDAIFLNDISFQAREQA